MTVTVNPVNDVPSFTKGADQSVRSRVVDGYTIVYAGLILTDVSALAIDPSAPATLYAGTAGGGVFKSANGGATWTLADGSQTPGNVNAIPDIPAHSVLVDPTNNQRIYVGTDLGVFVSLDGGANWLQEAGFPNVPVESLSLNKVAPTTKLYAFTHGRGAFSTVVAVDTADLAINKSLVTAGPYSPGQQITYSLVVSNAGPATATNIQVTDTPTNLTAAQHLQPPARARIGRQPLARAGARRAARLSDRGRVSARAPTRGAAAGLPADAA